MKSIVKVHIVCSGVHHDFDFVRLELLKLLDEDDHVRTTCSSTYGAIDEIANCDLLITYTNNVTPTAGQLAVLKDFLHGGGRWFALHGSCAIVRFSDGPVQDIGIAKLPGLVETPNLAPEFMSLIGCRFISHLTQQPFTVRAADPEHEIVRGIEPFEVSDEPYIMEILGEVQILLESRYTGSAPGYALSDWHEDLPRPLMLLHKVGEGEVLYLALGHSSGRFDTLDIIPELPVNRGPWVSPAYYELLRRGIGWGKAASQVFT